jgi:hypothetical protein
MGCEKRVFRNNQIRFDVLPVNKSWYRSQKKPGAFLGGCTVPAYARCRRTGAGGESPPIAARSVGDCRRRGKNPPSCAGRQPWGALFTPVRKIGHDSAAARRPKSPIKWARSGARGKRDQPITSLPTKRMNGFGPLRTRLRCRAGANRLPFPAILLAFPERRGRARWAAATAAAARQPPGRDLR